MFDKNQMEELMKKAGDIQKTIEETQSEVLKLEVIGEAGGGVVKAFMSGKHELKRISISSTLLHNKDKEMLEDLIVVAVNDAGRKVDEQITKKMAKITEGIPMDAFKNFKLPTQ